MKNMFFLEIRTTLPQCLFKYKNYHILPYIYNKYPLLCNKSKSDQIRQETVRIQRALLDNLAIFSLHLLNRYVLNMFLFLHLCLIVNFLFLEELHHTP